MNTKRNNARRAIEENLNEVVPPQDPENPQVPIKDGVMCNVKIRSAILSFFQVLATQLARDKNVKVRSNANARPSRIRDFTMMNPLTFYGSKVE